MTATAADGLDIQGLGPLDGSGPDIVLADRANNLALGIFTNSGTPFVEIYSFLNIIGNSTFGAMQIANTAAPNSPSAGLGRAWQDSTDLRFHDKNASGVIGTTIVSSTCGSSGLVTGYTVAGVANCATNAPTSTTATNSVITTKSDNSTYYPVFANADTGNLGLDAAAGLTFNPSTNTLTTTTFVGTLTGNVTGNVSGTAATVTGAAQSAITSVGTLSSLHTGTITSTATGGAIFTSVGADVGTNLAYMQLISSGAQGAFAIESSVGGTLVTGSTAYATMFGDFAGIATQIFVGAVVVDSFTSSGESLVGGFAVGSPAGGIKGSGTINAAGAYYANGTKGVTCSGALTVISSVTIKNGIITAASGTGGTCS
jgi:hypothetical protein